MNITGDSTRADQAMQGDAFWFGNPSNYITNNLAADMQMMIVCNCNEHRRDLCGHGHDPGLPGGRPAGERPADQHERHAHSGILQQRDLCTIPANMTLWWIRHLQRHALHGRSEERGAEGSWSGRHRRPRVLPATPVNNLTIDSMVCLGKCGLKLSNGNCF